MSDPIKELKAGFASACVSEEFSDCKIICGPYHFNAHKIILSAQSAYFKTAFKTGTFKEGASGIIELASFEENDVASSETDVRDDPEIVKLMMNFFYHFDYAVKDVQLTVVDHAKVFAIAIKYQVNGLRDLAATKFAEAVKSLWDCAEFPRAVHIVHHSTADDVLQLRKVVADTIHSNFDDLRFKDEIEAVVSRIPNLAYELLKRSRNLSEGGICEKPEHKRSKVQKVHCASCSTTSAICSSCVWRSTSSVFCINCGQYGRRI